MTTFSYTTGNPSNLTGGATANMNDIQGPFTDLRTAINGSLDETNVPNLTAAFTTYKTITWGGMSGLGSSLGAAQTFLMSGGPTVTATSAFILLAAANTGAFAFYLDPADYTANARTTKYNIRFGCLANATPSTISLTCGLYPVATFGGAAGANPTIATVGTVTSGSTVTFTTPGATSNTVTSSGDFTAPVAGWFVLGFTATGAGAANSALGLSAHLRVRQV